MSLELLADKDWLLKNESSLKDLFPEIWTHSANVNFLQLRFKLKLLGIDYRTEEDVSKILTFLTKIGIVEIRNMTNDTTQMRRSNTPLNVKER